MLRTACLLLSWHSLGLHTGGKPYSYEVCGKSTCNLHRMLHTGEKPYRCDQCEKWYRRKIDLDRHVTVHSNDRPYNCETCWISFRTKEILSKHLMTHIGEKLYCCLVYGKPFGRKFDLKRHLVMHERKSTIWSSDQVCHEPVCTVTEDGWRLDGLDLERRGIVLSL